MSLCISLVGYICFQFSVINLFVVSLNYFNQNSVQTSFILSYTKYSSIKSTENK